MPENEAYDMPRNISRRDGSGVDNTIVLVVGVGDDDRALVSRGTRSFGKAGALLALIRANGAKRGEGGSSMRRREWVYSMICVW